jgi:hypothetical protein
MTEKEQRIEAGKTYFLEIRKICTFVLYMIYIHAPHVKNFIYLGRKYSSCTIFQTNTILKMDSPFNPLTAAIIDSQHQVKSANAYI